MGHVHAGGIPSTRPALSGQALAARLLCGGAQPCAGAAHRHGAAGGSIASRGPEVRQRRGGHSGAHCKQAAVFRQGLPASVRPLHPGESAAAYAQVSGAQGRADATRWGGLATFRALASVAPPHGRPSARAMANTPRGKGVKAPKKVRSGRATARRLGAILTTLLSQKRASLKNQLRSNERALKKVRQAVPSRLARLRCRSPEPNTWACRSPGVGRRGEGHAAGGPGSAVAAGEAGEEGEAGGQVQAQVRQSPLLWCAPPATGLLCARHPRPDTHPLLRRRVQSGSVS